MTIAVSQADAISLPPGGTYVFSETDQASLCSLAPRRIANAKNGTIFVGGVPATMVGTSAVTTRAAISAGTVEYRHAGGLVGDVMSVLDDCFGISRVMITVQPPVCGDEIVGPGEECDAGAGGDECCGSDCRLVVSGPGSVECRLRALIAWIQASGIRPSLQRTLIAALERVLFRIERLPSETGRRRDAFVRSAGRRLASFATRVRSYEGRRAITSAERDFMLGASEPLRHELAASSATP